jgi:hypothetical protein
VKNPEHRVPPHSLDAEGAVLGGVLIGGAERLDAVADLPVAALSGYRSSRQGARPDGAPAMTTAASRIGSRSCRRANADAEQPKAPRESGIGGDDMCLGGLHPPTDVEPVRVISTRVA